MLIYYKKRKLLLCTRQTTHFAAQNNPKCKISFPNKSGLLFSEAFPNNNAFYFANVGCFYVSSAFALRSTNLFINLQAPYQISQNGQTLSKTLYNFVHLATIGASKQAKFYSTNVELYNCVKTTNECESKLLIYPYSFIDEKSTFGRHCLKKFINLCMKHGKKNKSLKIISNILRRLSVYEGAAKFNVVKHSNEEPLSRAYFQSVWSISAANDELFNKMQGGLLHTAKNFRNRQPQSLLNEMLLPASNNQIQILNGQPDKAVSTKRFALSTPFGLLLLIKAVNNVKPIIEVKKVRISGTTQLVPSIIPKNRQITLALRWIIEAAVLRRNAKRNNTLDQCFFAELIDASQNIGTVRKRRDDLHKLAESNRGFAHYRWWSR